MVAIASISDDEMAGAATDGVAGFAGGITAKQPFGGSSSSEVNVCRMPPAKLLCRRT